MLCDFVRRSVRHWLHREQVVDGAGGERSRREDRFGVALQSFDPARDVLGVIGARRVGDLEIGAEKRGPELGDEFFERIRVVTEALAELAIEPVLGTAPVRLMPISA